MSNISRILGWSPRLATVVAAAAVSLTALPPAVAAAAPPPNLMGEKLFARLGGANPADDRGSFAVVSRHCDPNGISTISFVASGPATGPYPGTFQATGTMTIGPQQLSSIPPFLNGAVAGFDASFTITPDSTDTRASFAQVTATEHIAEPLNSSPNTCQDFDPPFNGNGWVAAGGPTFEYHVTIKTVEGSYRDGGEGFADVGALGRTSGPDFGTFSEGFFWGGIPQPIEDRDTTAPTLSVPAGITVEAAGPSGAAVTFSTSATDDRDPHPTVTCAPSPGAVFGLGMTTVTCIASDAAGNTSSPASFVVTVIDTTPPTLTVPTALSTDATSSTGAIVNYGALASDLVDATPVVSCSPGPGSVFPIGDTAVTCTAADAAGNRTAPETFIVHVKPATEQISDVATVVTAVDAKQGVVESLDAKLQNVLDALNSAKAGDKASACKKLDAFISEVQAQTGKALTQTDADGLIADARRIKSVIGCG